MTADELADAIDEAESLMEEDDPDIRRIGRQIRTRLVAERAARCPECGEPADRPARDWRTGAFGIRYAVSGCVDIFHADDYRDDFLADAILDGRAT